MNLQQAVCAILRARPIVLGVDLDTSGVTVHGMPRSLTTQIVWARGISISRKPAIGGKVRAKINQGLVLGQANPNALSGLAVAEVHDDWSVRTIPICYVYDEGRVMPTLVAELARAAGARISDC